MIEYLQTSQSYKINVSILHVCFFWASILILHIQCGFESILFITFCFVHILQISPTITCQLSGKIQRTTIITERKKP